MTTGRTISFNSQPREGGWATFMPKTIVLHGFNSQPREGGWKVWWNFQAALSVSTRSRAKAAGVMREGVYYVRVVSTRSRAKAAGGSRFSSTSRVEVSTRSRAKAAGFGVVAAFLRQALFQLAAARRRLGPVRTTRRNPWEVSTRSRAKAAGARRWMHGWCRPFQLAAARRRLVLAHIFKSRANGFQLAAARRRLDLLQNRTISI